MRNKFLLILALSFLSMLTALSVDIYLPSVPVIASDFVVTDQQVSISLSIFLFSYAFGQLFYGPVSDHFGRLSTLKFGLIIYALSSLLCALSSSLHLFYLTRFFQGFAACCGPITSFALVGDLFDREHGAKINAYIDIAVSIAPMLAPILGTYITSHYGWRASFLFLVIVALVLIVVTWALIPETRIGKTSKISIEVLKNYPSMLSHFEFRLFAIANALALSALMAFISISPYLFISVLGMSSENFSILFAANSGMLILGGYLASQCTQRFGILKSVTLGAFMMFIGGILMGIFNLIGIVNSKSILISAMISTLGVSIILPNSTAGAISLFKETTGASAALLGFLRFACAGTIASFVSFMTQSSSLPLAFTIGACGFVVFIRFLYFLNSNRNVMVHSKTVT